MGFFWMFFWTGIQDSPWMNNVITPHLNLIIRMVRWPINSIWWLAIW
jgi:hypothetical protein